MQAITQNGVTYFPGANGTWMGTDGKKYVSRGPKNSRQFMEISGGSAYVAPDAGDAMDGGGGFSMRDQSIRVNNNGVAASGTDTGVKPMDIPDFVRNPFSSVQLPQTGDHNSVASVPTQQRQVNIGGKMYDMDMSEGEQADLKVETGASADNDYSVNPSFNSEKPEIDLDGPSGIDWMKDQRTDNEMARRSAFLDAPMGTGPRELIEKRDAAMGMYKGQLKTDDGMIDMSKEQRNDYLNRGDAFLKDVMSGTIKLGGDKSEKAGTEDIYETDTVDFNPDLGIETFGGMKSGGDPGVDFFGQHPYEDVPVLPGMMSDITGNPAGPGAPVSGALTHEQIAALPKIQGPNGELVPDLRHLYN